MTKNFNTLYTQIHAILSAKFGEVKVPSSQTFESRCEDLYYDTPNENVRIWIRTDFVKTTNVKCIHIDLAVKDPNKKAFFPIINYMLDLYNPVHKPFSDIFFKCRGGRVDTVHQTEDQIIEFVKRITESF